MPVPADTGAAVTVFNSTMVESLGLKAGRGGSVRGAGGDVRTTQIADVTLDVGGAALKGLNAAALPLAPFENTVGRAIDGILGGRPPRQQHRPLRVAIAREARAPSSRGRVASEASP